MSYDTDRPLPGAEKALLSLHYSRSVVLYYPTWLLKTSGNGGPKRSLGTLENSDV